MKAKFLLTMMIVLLASVFATAQENDKNYGEQPDVCREKLSTYDQFYNQENYKDAYNAWSWCFKNCPQATKNIYIQGPNILEWKIKNTAGDEKEAYIDTLFMIFDQRTQYYGDEGINKGRKAIKMMSYRPRKAKKAYKLFQEAIALDSTKAEVNAIGRYMQLSTLLYKNKLIEPGELIENYAKLSSLLSVKVEENERGAEKAKNQIDAMIVNTGVLDCEKMEEIFTPMFEARQDDVEFLKTIQYMMKNQKCFSAVLYAKVSEKLYESDKNATTAHILAQYFFKNSDIERAEFYYTEALELQEDEMKKADLYYELGFLTYSNKKQYQAARTYARKAIAADPNYGKAYKLIAQIYAASASDCGTNNFEKLAVYWVVVDNLVKAKSIDPSIAEDVNPMIAKYSAKYPKKSDAFFYGITEGQTYQINCWIGESTKVRFNN